MAEIGGVDYRARFGQNFAGKLVPLTLRKFSNPMEDASRPTAAPVESATEYAGEGLFQAKKERIEGAIVEGEFIFILGGSLPNGINPTPEDEILYQGTTYSVKFVESDSSEAWFNCRVEA